MLHSSPTKWTEHITSILSPSPLRKPLMLNLSWRPLHFSAIPFGPSIRLSLITQEPVSRPHKAQAPCQLGTPTLHTFSTHKTNNKHFQCALFHIICLQFPVNLCRFSLVPSLFTGRVFDGPTIDVSIPSAGTSCQSRL